MNTTNIMNADTHTWHGKPYYSLDAFCKNTYGEKLYKVSLDAGLTCPNRDGTLDTRGCIFCSAGGSGDFAAAIRDITTFSHAFEESIHKIAAKHSGQKYIAYFQAYTNTYGPVSYLESIYRLALTDERTAGISIATRPDCLPDEVLTLLADLKNEFADKFIWIELGLQTIHQSTADFIRRGYPLSCFDEAVHKLNAHNIPVIVHVILGLPRESKAQMLETITYLNRCHIWGIKLQMLHILKGTHLGTLYETQHLIACNQNSSDNPSAGLTANINQVFSDCGSFSDCQEYLTILIDCLTHLRPDIVVHRLTGDAPRKLLLAPLWGSDKRQILNLLHKQMKEQSAYQGMHYPPKPWSAATRQSNTIQQQQTPRKDK